MLVPCASGVLASGTKGRKSGPKKRGGPREGNGRLSRQLVDRGTQQLQARRAFLANGSDPALSATASGILYAQGILSQEQYDAAVRYAWAHALSFGTIWRQACPLVQRGEGASPAPDELLAVAKDKLARMDSKLAPDQRQAVADLAAFNVLLGWWVAQKLRLRQLPEDAAAREALLSGLDALAK
jgi:hypothetical protein